MENGAVEDISPPNLDPTVEDLFEEGIDRLHHRETWKLWRWPQSSNVFYSPDEFKCAPSILCLICGKRRFCTCAS